MSSLLRTSILRAPRLLLAVLSLVLIASPAWAAPPPDLGDDDVFDRIEAYVAAQPVPVTAHNIANQFAVLADDPSYGTAAQFGASVNSTVAVTALSATHFVVTYMRSFEGKALVGSLSGTTITYGAENTFEAAVISDPSVAALSATHFVITYSGGLGAKAIVGKVSGVTIDSFGAAVSISNSSSATVAALSATHFVLAYYSFLNGQGEALIGQVTGTSITLGTASDFNAGFTGDISVAALSATHFVIAYVDSGTGSHGTAIVGSVSGDSITGYGSEHVFNAAATDNTKVASLSSTHIVVAYSDDGNGEHGTAIVGSITGLVIAFGSESVFNAAETKDIAVDALDASSFVVVYYEGDFSSTCDVAPCLYNSIVGDVSGTAISGYSNEIAVDASIGDNTEDPGVANIGSFVVVYVDVADNNGKAIVGSTGSLPVELTDFTATTDARDVLLRWNTASETNNAGFQVQYQAVEPDEQAPDQQLAHWQVDGFVEGQGTTLQAQRYTYRLADLEPGRYRLRLKQLDYDGTFEYSPVTETTIELAEQFALTPAYPNPFNPEAQFTLSVQRRQQVSVRVYNVLGRVVATLHEGEMAANQAQRFRFDASALPSGAYQIQVVGETFQASERVVLMK